MIFILLNICYKKTPYKAIVDTFLRRIYPSFLLRSHARKYNISVVNTLIMFRELTKPMEHT